jgi:hypothetical protein
VWEGSLLLPGVASGPVLVSFDEVAGAADLAALLGGAGVVSMQAPPGVQTGFKLKGVFKRGSN